MSKVAYIFESLGPGALRTEAGVQLFLFAAAHKAEERHRPGSKPRVSLIAVDGDSSGRDVISSWFPVLSSDDVDYVSVPKPLVQIVGLPEHQQVHAVFEALKAETFDEIHFADARGFGHYLTLAKTSGLFFVNTLLVAHVLGSTLFCKEAEESLVDSETMLLLDVFECTSIENADLVLVHDRKAWSWYQRKLPSVPSQVFDISWSTQSRARQVPLKKETSGKKSGAAREKINRIIYFGVLGPEGGLRSFCDAVTRLLADPDFPVEVVFVGEPKSVGAVDAITYIRIRAQAWKVPVTIERNLTLPEELALVARQDGIVVCNAMRKHGLRSRLFDSLNIKFVLICDEPDRTGALTTETPARIVAKIQEIANTLPAMRPPAELGAVWRPGRTWEIPPTNRISHHAAENDNPLVTVIITHFCRPEKLRAAVRSLRAQSYCNFQVIIVDDGSPDPTISDELQSIEQEISPLGWRLIRQENKYLGAARNFGAKQAKGKYLLFMDDDNIARPEEIKTLVDVAERLGADIVSPFYDGFTSEDEIEQNKPSMRFAPVGNDLALAVFSPCFGDANALYSTKFFRKLGGFSEDYGITHEDWEFHVRASIAGANRITLPVPLFWYRVDSAGMYRNRQMQLHKSANLRRHIRPYLETLPHFQGKLVQIAQGLSSFNRNITTPKVTWPSAVVGPVRNANAPFARVAIIVRTKDRPVMLQRAIRDILDQSYKDWITVIVNDGGDNEALEIVLEQFSTELGNRVLIVSNAASVGMQSASNMGISVCDSDFIVIHDDDDTWNSEFLSRTVAHMDARGWNPRVAGIVTWSQVIVEEIRDGYEIVETNRHLFDSKLHALSLAELGIQNRFPPISFLFRRSAFEHVGRFREEFGVLGDWDFHLRMLEKYELHVIPEPLAGYHHRTQHTAGAYGNSVHAQKDIHAAKRIELVNSFLRGGEDGRSNLDQVLLQGELYKVFEREQRTNFEKLHNYLWEIEQRVKYIADETYKREKIFKLPRWKIQRRKKDNLVENGDFRFWPGVGKVYTGKNSSYGIVCPGFLVKFDGIEVSHQLERKTTVDEKGIPKGKSYLCITNKGQASTHKSFYLECVIADVGAVAGQTICISGLARLQSQYERISVGGRFDLPDRTKRQLPEKKVLLSREFKPWSCTLECPAPGSIDYSKAVGRVYMRLHYGQPFTLEVTDIQVETGNKPTGFRYRASSQGGASSSDQGIIHTLRASLIRLIHRTPSNEGRA